MIQKERGKKPQTRKFHDNRWTGERRSANEATARRSTLLQQLEVEQGEEIESGIVSTPNAKPTRSEENLQKLYKIMEDWSVVEKKADDHSDADGADREVMVIKHELEVYRLIHIGIIVNQNTASQFACTFCFGTMQLFEVSMQG